MPAPISSTPPPAASSTTSPLNLEKLRNQLQNLLQDDLMLEFLCEQAFENLLSSQHHTEQQDFLTLPQIAPLIENLLKAQGKEASYRQVYEIWTSSLQLDAGASSTTSSGTSGGQKQPLHNTHSMRFPCFFQFVVKTLKQLEQEIILECESRKSRLLSGADVGDMRMDNYADEAEDLAVENVNKSSDHDDVEMLQEGLVSEEPIRHSRKITGNNLRSTTTTRNGAGNTVNKNNNFDLESLTSEISLRVSASRLERHKAQQQKLKMAHLAQPKSAKLKSSYVLGSGAGDVMETGSFAKGRDSTFSARNNKATRERSYSRERSSLATVQMNSKAATPAAEQLEESPRGGNKPRHSATFTGATTSPGGSSGAHLLKNGGTPGSRRGSNTRPSAASSSNRVPRSRGNSGENFNVHEIDKTGTAHHRLSSTNHQRQTPSFNNSSSGGEHQGGKTNTDQGFNIPAKHSYADDGSQLVATVDRVDELLAPADKAQENKTSGAAGQETSATLGQAHEVQPDMHQEEPHLPPPPPPEPPVATILGGRVEIRHALGTEEFQRCLQETKSCLVSAEGAGLLLDPVSPPHATVFTSEAEVQAVLAKLKEKAAALQDLQKSSLDEAAAGRVCAWYSFCDPDIDVVESINGAGLVNASNSGAVNAVRWRRADFGVGEKGVEELKGDNSQEQMLAVAASTTTTTATTRINPSKMIGDSWLTGAMGLAMLAGEKGSASSSAPSTASKSTLSQKKSSKNTTPFQYAFVKIILSQHNKVRAKEAATQHGSQRNCLYFVVSSYKRSDVSTSVYRVSTGCLVWFWL